MLKHSLLLFLLLLFSCRERPFCKVKEGSSGEILGNVFIPCLINSGSGLVIRNASELNAVVDSSCGTISVDFTSESLLALRASGGCDVGFERRVIKDATNKTYHYQVIVTSCGLCKSLAMSDNIVRVLAIPNDWTVTFEVIGE